MSLYANSSPHRRQPSNASTVSVTSTAFSFPSSRSTTVSSTTSNSSRFGSLEAREGSAKHKHTMSLGANISPMVSSYTTNSIPTTPPRSSAGTTNFSPLGSRHSRGNSHPPPSASGSPQSNATGSPRSLHRPLPTPTPYNSSFRQSVISGTTSLKESDIDSLRNSSVSHFRTLSRIKNEGANQEFAIDAGQDVAGMYGRKRLQRANTDNLTSWERMNWMDKRRQYIQAYEYLCHIGEAKEWLESCIGEPIPPVVELEEALRDGVTLAKLVRVFAPELVPRIFEAKKLQFRHSDNIDRFFKFLKRVELPEIFIFELTDLYNKKNIPKVIYCLHALSYLLIRLGLTDNSIGNLVGKLEFTEAEIQNTQRGLDMAGVSLPSFRGVNKHFGDVEPEPEPVESEEDRIERELKELEPDLIELQRICRGFLVRSRLAHHMELLWDSEDSIIELQALTRGMFARVAFGYKADMSNWATDVQAHTRGYLIRQAMLRQLRHFTSHERLIIRLQARYRGRKLREKFRRQKMELELAMMGIIELQAAARGMLLRAKLGAQIGDVYENEDNVVDLQARARGALLRMSLAAKMDNVFESEQGITDVQSAIRGVLARRKKERLLSDLKDAEEEITALQGAIRGKLMRKNISKDAENLGKADDSLTRLMAGARGMLVRKAIQQDLAALKEVESMISALQAAARGALIRKNMERDRGMLQAEDKVLPYLQAAIRGYMAIGRAGLTRAEYWRKLKLLEEATEEVVELQAHARGALARSAFDAILDELDAQVEGVVDLQSRARGALQRWAVSDILDALDNEVDSITDTQAHARGFLFRQQQGRFLDELYSEMDSIIEMQAAIRGALVRSYVDDIILAVQDEEDAIIELQAAARGFLQRKAFFGKLKHFRENMEKVVKIQSFVRAKQQGEAYKSLMGGKNPPVGTVKNFVHLLNDSDFDFDEEIEFETLRKNVVQHIRANELAEAYVSQLDIKIALLVKNKITLDEIIKHQKRFTGHVGNLLSNTAIASSDPFDLKALNNNSRKRLERYQQMFFALQTQPLYLTRLFQRVREQNTPDQELKKIENLVMGIFGYAQKRREEYYLLKLIAKSIKEEVYHCSRPEEYLRVNFFWMKLAMNYIRSPRDRKFMRHVLGTLIREEFIENEELDLECDPQQIYLSSINNEELRTGQRSKRDPSVGRDVAIKDQETRETFVAHLSALKSLADDFISSLEDNLNLMPYGIRYIAQQSVQALIERFPDENEEAILQIVENFIYQKYWGPAVLAPETYGVVEKAPTPMQKKNLGELGKLLNQISSGRLFAQANLFLQPLNNHIPEAVGRMKSIFRTIVNVPDLKTRFDMDEFEDLTSKEKPTLYIKMSDIFTIHRLIAQDVEAIAPSKEDQMRVIVGELGSVKTSEAELKNVGNTEIVLHLDPHFQKIEDPDSEVNALFVETKRCILYIIRVQTGSNLMEILVKPITAEDEERWETLLEEERAQTGKKNAYADATTLCDINSMTYGELKRTALECIIRLESTGKITRKNQYQDLLNAIALDIRTKHRRRVQRAREVEGVKLTLAHLNEKAVYLEGQLQSYNDYIEQAMVTLQTKKGKKKVVLPFTRQYFHMRELQKSGRVPEFGSFKYNARGLADKGVLVSLAGFPERKWDKIGFTIYSEVIGVFHIEASNGSMMIPGASADVLLDDLLQKQFHNNQFLVLCDGMMKFNVNLLLHLIFKKFYGDE
ncbi:hypothetical protein L873DRAFT_279649 [Choiromyces venosus 120613-1]|uniref:Uncharacterized protein n=1 Tax=Choiromyces venosus 120613-1 TaxID=1336337 RepID=A0A3N4JXM8_9PEZI|nr:hypothetical protein L873DRAFT_279649 [Choiromyces venosus 120613-1]